MTTSMLVLGTAQFGSLYGINNRGATSTFEEAFHILDMASEAGIRVLDTAPAYGPAQHIIGSYHAATGRRFLVNSKFKASPDGTVEEILTTSLGDLGIESVQVLFYHSFSDFVRFPQILDELRRLKQKGLIQEIGISVYTNEEFEQAANVPLIDVIQFPFNLLDNYTVRGAFLNAARHNRKTLQARSVFLQGLFFVPTEELPHTVRPLQKYLERLRRLCEEYQTSMHSLALNYVLSNRAIHSVLVGVDSREQLKRNLEATRDRELPPRLIDEINRIVVTETKLLNPSKWQ